MGMADSRPDLLMASLPLHRCDDGELTSHCDHEVRWRGDGRHVTIGVHRTCVDRIVSKPAPAVKGLVP